MRRSKVVKSSSTLLTDRRGDRLLVSRSSRRPKLPNLVFASEILVLAPRVAGARMSTEAPARALEYFERFQTLIEDVIGASIDEALSTQPENPIVTIAAALLKRCKVDSAADAALLRSAASSLGMGTAEQFNILRNQTSTDASGLEDNTAAVDAPPVVRRSSSAAVSSSSYESVTSEDMDDLKARRLHGMLGELRTLCCDLRETFGQWIAGDDPSNTQGSSSTLLSSKSSKLPVAAVTELRSCLCDAQQLVQVTQEAIYALLADEPTRGRAGFLISLSDRIGAPPSDRKWRDEWNALKLEAIVLSGQGEFASEEYVNESCTVERTTKQNHAAIVKLVNRGWYPHEAIAYRLLSSVSPPNVLMTSDCLS